MSGRVPLIKRRLRKFGAEESSTQGLFQAGTSRRNICLGFWLLVTLIALGFLIWQIVLLVQKYYEYEVDVQIELKFEQRVFPSVTVCNVNPYKKSVAYQYEKIDRLMSAYKYMARKIVCSTVSFCSFQENATLSNDAKMYGFEAINNTGVLQQRVRNLLPLEAAAYDMTNAHSTFQEIVRACSFNTRSCEESSWTPLNNLTTMGQCFTFNLNSSLMTERAGPIYGLRLVLATNTSEYLASVTAAGLAVLIHDEQQYPFVDSLGYIVHPGTASTMSVTYMQMERLGSPYSECSDDKPDWYLYSLAYNAEACQRSSIQHAIVSECGCYDPSYPAPSANLTACRIPDDLACWDGVVANISANASCYQPCTESFYTVTTSAAKWPDGSSGFVSGCLEGMYGAESCTDVYSKNMLTLSVYYEKLNYESVQESPDDSISITLSNFGGQIGLWLGMSLISLIEFLILGLQLCANLISPRMGKFVDY